MPPDDSAWCGYLADWVAIKARWQLNLGQSEFGHIRDLLTDRCAGQLIDFGPPVPETPPTTTPPAAPPPVQPVLPEQAVGSSDPAYPTVCIPPAPPDLACGDITDRRFTVLAPDPHHFDGSDAEGIGCENDEGPPRVEPSGARLPVRCRGRMAPHRSSVNSRDCGLST
jgi:hypothetical protein